MSSENQDSKKGLTKNKRSGEDRRVADDNILIGTDRRKNNNDRREKLKKDEGKKDKGSGKA